MASQAWVTVRRDIVSSTAQTRTQPAVWTIVAGRPLGSYARPLACRRTKNSCPTRMPLTAPAFRVRRSAAV